MTAGANGLIRQDPPPAIGGRGPSGAHLDIADTLREDPGNWYRIAEGEKTASIASGIKNATLVAYRPKGSFEAVSRRIEGAWSIWARYVGEV